MSKTAKFQIDLEVWSDESETTNDPKQNDFRWFEQLSGLTLEGVSTLSVKISTLSNISPIVTSNPSRYLFIKTDQPLAIKFDGDAGQLNTVNPSAVGVQDGILFQTGNFSALQIDNLGAVTANVLVFIGG